MNTGKMFAYTLSMLLASCGNRNYDEEKAFLVAVYGSAVEIIDYIGFERNLVIPPRIKNRPLPPLGQTLV